MQLVVAENVVRHTNRPALVVTTLGDSSQTIHEGEKFGVECVRSRDGKYPSGARVVVTNYERLHYFTPSDFSLVVANESSILKNVDGVTRDAVIEFMRTRPYRLLCTATAAPNDYVELGNSAEALGELGYSDMVTKFFKQETKKDYLGWGRTKYRLRGHAERDFWRWVCSWSRACRKPSDLGFDDGPFVLPPVVTNEYVVKARTKPDGMLFDLPAISLQEQQAEQRRTLQERCEKVAELVSGTGQPAVCWCHLNPEGDLIEKLIPDAEQLSGKDFDERKEELLTAFAAGQIRVLVTKSKLAGFGLNWQHCAHQTFFPSHSWEAFYQCFRRSWRFGQKRQVVLDIVASEGQAGVQANLQRKADAADRMFTRQVTSMNDVLNIQRTAYGSKQEEVPSWLASTRN